MKNLLILSLILCVVNVSAQSIKVKNHHSLPGSGSTTQMVDGMKCSVKAKVQELALTVKNSSDESVVLDPSAMTLHDITERGVKLCGEAITIAPGKKGTVVVEPCNGEQLKKGLFGMRYAYPSKAAFKEAGFFLRNKKFVLSFDGHKMEFYTDL
jgi:hypothetical protein